MAFPGFDLILGGQKSPKMETCSKHEKHEKNMAGTANLRLQGVQKSIKIKSNKKQKNRTPEKTEKRHRKGILTEGSAAARGTVGRQL